MGWGCKERFTFAVVGVCLSERVADPNRLVLPVGCTACRMPEIAFRVQLHHHKRLASVLAKNRCDQAAILNLSIRRLCSGLQRPLALPWLIRPYLPWLWVLLFATLCHTLDLWFRKRYPLNFTSFILAVCLKVVFTYTGGGEPLRIVIKPIHTFDLQIENISCY